MKIQKDVAASLAYPYSVSVFEGSPRRVFAASEKKGPCLYFPFAGGEARNVWGDELGGCTGICQIPGTDRQLLAIEGFYKGFQCQGAGIVHAVQNGDGWRVERVCDLPFAHRMCVCAVEDAMFVLVGNLCAGKDCREDWSKPGALYLARWPGRGPLVLEPLIEGLTQHHGMFKGTLDGRAVVLVSGRDGVFEVEVPGRADGEWRWRKLLDQPIGDVCLFDLDGDGEDELITIENFHGSELGVYKRRGDAWLPVYSFPVSFGHFVWAGNILGKSAIITGYRRSNGALALLRKHPGEWRFDVEYIDQLGAPINMDIVHEPGREVIFATNENTHQVMRYILTE